MLQRAFSNCVFNFQQIYKKIIKTEGMMNTKKKINAHIILDQFVKDIIVYVQVVIHVYP